MSTRIFLLDDDTQVRRGLRELLETVPGFLVVGEAGSAAEARARIPDVRPDVTIFDARLRSGSGIQVCRQLLSEDPTISALVLTAYDDDTALSSAILAGASGYLLKDIRGQGLISAIKAAAAGEQLIRSDEIDRIRRRWAHAPAGDPRLGRLSPMEQDILDQMSLGLTNRRIARRFSLSETVVEGHVTAVLGKLGLSGPIPAGLVGLTETRPYAESLRPALRGRQ